MRYSVILWVFFLGQSFVAAQDYPFEVKVYGSGDPVIMIPGFACPGDVWEDAVEALREDFELHVFTLAGFGGVEPVEFPWLPRIRKGLVDYVQDLNLEGAGFVGHSMGGTLGLWLAAENPGLFSTVISVDGLPAMGAVMFPNYDPENFSYDSEYNKQILDMDDASFAGMAGQMAMGMTSSAERRTLVAEWIKESDRETYVYGYTDLLKLDLREQLENINLNVVMIAATRPFGKELVRQNIQNQFAGLEDYTLILAEDASHFIMFDQPEWLIERLREALGEK